MKKWQLQIMVGVCGMILAGCHKSEPVVPKLSAPDKWQAKTKIVKTKDNLACIPWWKSFKDLDLNWLIHKGLTQNNELSMSLAHVEAAKGELKRVELSWLPNIDSLLGYSSFPTPGFPGVIAVGIPTYTLNLLKQAKENKKAKYLVEASENEHAALRLAVIHQIASNYFSYQAQLDKIYLLSEIERELKSKVAIYRATYNGGITNNIDLVDVKAKLAIIRSEIMVLQQNIVVYQNNIRYLMNENPKPLGLKNKYPSLITTRAPVGGLPLTVLENRPDLKQAENELRAQHQEVGMAISNFLPTMQLSMARGKIGEVENSYKLRTNVYFNQYWLQTPLLNLSFFGDVAKAKGHKKAAFYKFIDTYRKVLREVDTDLSAYDNYGLRLSKTITAKNDIKRDYQLSRNLYNKGIISYLDLLEKQIKYNEMRVMVNEHKLDQLLTIVNLYQDMALGYGCQ